MGLLHRPTYFAAFVWWFSTGAVLLLVGRFGPLRSLSPGLRGVLVAAALPCLVLSADDTTVGAAYLAFTATILLWAAQEIPSWQAGHRPHHGNVPPAFADGNGSARRCLRSCTTRSRCWCAARWSWR